MVFKPFARLIAYGYAYLGRPNNMIWNAERTTYDGDMMSSYYRVRKSLNMPHVEKDVNSPL